MVNSNTNSSSACANDVVEKTRKIVLLQLAMMLLVSIIFSAWYFDSGKSLDMILAVGYGGLISVVSALLLGLGVKRATEGALLNPAKSTVILYAGAAQRFVLVLAAFAVGLAVLKLYPLGLFAGFVAAQLAYLLSMCIFKH